MILKNINKKATWLVFGIFLILELFVSFYHEPWADEAQAWLLARDSGIFELLTQRTRYDGHPALWYLILYFPSRILEYEYISYIPLVFSLLAVTILLKHAPFPPYITYLLPFCYFIFYQYGVISRNYVLIAPLIFMIAVIYWERYEKNWKFTLLVVLLLYTHVYSAVISVSLMGLYVVGYILNIDEFSAMKSRRIQLSILLYGTMLILFLFLQWLPKDLPGHMDFHFDLHKTLTLSSKVITETYTGISWVSYLVLAISLLWFWIRGVFWEFVLPSLVVLLLFSTKYYNYWHQGILFLIWLFAMWISHSRKIEERTNKSPLVFTRYIVNISFLLVLWFHLYWSFSSSVSDLRGTYSAGESLAMYIKNENLAEHKIAAIGYWTTTVQPYYKKNIFINHNKGKGASYWYWSVDNNREEKLDIILRMKPEIILVSRPQVSGELQLKDYDFVSQFPGTVFWKDTIMESNHIAVYRKTHKVSSVND